MTSNFINTDMASLIRLHNLGLINDKAFTEAVKKLNTTISSPLHPTVNRPDPNHVNVPFIQRTGTGSDDLIKKWTSTGSPLTATYTPDGKGISTPIQGGSMGIQIGSAMGVINPDIYSGSILKPEGIDTTVLANKVYGDGVFCASGRVDVVPYSENRNHLPDHAQMVLSWIDEAWKDKVDEYNATKGDWERIQYTDEENNEVVEWIEKIKHEKDLETYKKFIEENVVVEGDDAQLNGLQHIFHLSIGKDEC